MCGLPRLAALRRPAGVLELFPTEGMMKPTVNHPAQSTVNGSPSKRASAANTNTPLDTAQTTRDVEEKRKHSRSENALQSSQDKNPIPPDSTRHS
ncbi:hypothetical protein CIC12_31430 [Burkholderia sp. SG-MS1]|nr:hypothetical protein [Paraburkholderia sp. SG-MS1]